MSLTGGNMSIIVYTHSHYICHVIYAYHLFITCIKLYRLFITFCHSFFSLALLYCSLFNKLFVMVILFFVSTRHLQSNNTSNDSPTLLFLYLSMYHAFIYKCTTIPVGKSSFKKW